MEKEMLEPVFRLTRGCDVETYVRGEYTTPVVQLALVEQWNAVRAWGFAPEDFRQAAHAMPHWPEAAHLALVLVPYLADDEDTCGPFRTLLELGHLARDRLHDAGARLTLTREAHLASAEPRPHSVGLHWEEVATGRTLRAGSAATSAVQLLAAVALHPRWAERVLARRKLRVVSPTSVVIEAEPVRRIPSLTLA